MPKELWMILVVLLVGFGTGRMWGDHPAEAAQQATEPFVQLAATATREAELEELADLRTKVAEKDVPVICTLPPEPTEALTPTPVPPIEAGQALSYRGDWTVTVTGASTRSTINALAAEGVYVLVDMTIMNDSTNRRHFPFGEFHLQDDTGRVYSMARAETTAVSGTGWYRLVDTSRPTNFTIVYDVAADAGQTFILQSREDPTFRVRVELVQRG